MSSVTGSRSRSRSRFAAWAARAALLPVSVGWTAATLLFAAPAAARAETPVVLQVDGTDAPRGLFRVAETIPARPGALALVYPKWIPGEHRPSGPIENMVDLHIFSGGKEIAWQRDPVEMFVFHVTVPAGADAVTVRFTDAEAPGTATTSQLARVKWNRLLLYPQGVPSDDLPVQASIRLPDGWKYGTALKPVGAAAPTAANAVAPSGPVAFETLPLTHLIDSPLLIGRHFRVVTLPTIDGRTHEIDIAAQTPRALGSLGPQTEEGMANLVREADALWGAHH